MSSGFHGPVLELESSLDWYVHFAHSDAFGGTTGARQDEELRANQERNANEKWPAGAGIQFGSFSGPGEVAPR